MKLILETRVEDPTGKEDVERHNSRLEIVLPDFNPEEIIQFARLRQAESAATILHAKQAHWPPGRLLSKTHAQKKHGRPPASALRIVDVDWSRYYHFLPESERVAAVARHPDLDPGAFNPAVLPPTVRFRDGRMVEVGTLFSSLKEAAECLGMSYCGLRGVLIKRAKAAAEKGPIEPENFTFSILRGVTLKWEGDPEMLIRYAEENVSYG